MIVSRGSSNKCLKVLGVPNLTLATMPEGFMVASQGSNNEWLEVLGVTSWALAISVGRSYSCELRL